MSRNFSRWIGPLALAALALIVYRSILGLGHIGWDVWPLVRAAKIGSLGEFFGTFTEELMDGQYGDGHFYRPLTHFSFAFDWMLWGGRAFGYHLNDLALLPINAWLIARLVRLLFRIESGPGPMIAAVLFILHPAQMDVLPASARRADSLCLLFTLAAVLVHARDTKRGSLLAGLFALLAVASKETGLLVAPLLLASGMLLNSGGIREWWKGALQRSLPALITLGLFILARTLVLGGLGGHEETGVSGILENAFEFGLDYCQNVLVPHGEFFGIEARTGAWIAASVVAVSLGVQLLMSRADVSRPFRQLGLLSVWIVLLLVVSIASGRFQPWYSMAFVAVLAILVGFLSQTLWTELTARRFAHVIPPLIACVAACSSPLATSLPFRPQPEWAQVSQASEAFLEEFSTTIARARKGVPVELRLPAFIHYQRADREREMAVLAPYSVAAWLRMFPQGKRVSLRVASQPPPRAEVIDIVFRPFDKKVAHEDAIGTEGL